MGVVCILLLAFIQIACGKPNQCLEAKDSCKSDDYLTCYLNGQVVDKNSCYKKVCRDTDLVDEYDCPTGFQYHASGICYHVGQVPLSWEDARSYCEKFGGLFDSDLATVTSEAIQQGIESFFSNHTSTTSSTKGYHSMAWWIFSKHRAPNMEMGVWTNYIHCCTALPKLG